MANYLARVIFGGAGAIIATAVGGPLAGVAAWKLIGAGVTGNPLHLVPGLGSIAEGMDIVAFDGGPGFDIHGNPADADILGNRPSDIHGNPVGNDAWGNANNRPLHG